MNKVSGFTLFEMLAALAIMGFLIGLIYRYKPAPKPGEQRKIFINKLNSLMKFVSQSSITTGNVHKVDFDFKNRVIRTFIVPKKKGEKAKPLMRSYIKTSLELPVSYDFKNFFIEGEDMMKKYAFSGTTGAYFFIVPEGLSQSVVINFLDKKDMAVWGRARQVGLVLNPFTVQFKVYDTFKNP